MMIIQPEPPKPLRPPPNPRPICIPPLSSIDILYDR